MIYVLRWNDLSEEESYFMGQIELSEFIEVVEEIKKGIKPGSTFNNDKAYVVNKLSELGIKEISVGKHTLWRFFN